MQSLSDTGPGPVLSNYLATEGRVMDSWWKGKGVDVAPDRCAESVPDGLVMRQCRRRRGHGPGAERTPVAGR